MLSLRPSHYYVPTSFSCNFRMKRAVFLSREIYSSAPIEGEEFLGWITARRKTMALEWFALTTSEVLLSCAIIALVWLLLRLVKSSFSQKRYDPLLEFYGRCAADCSIFFRVRTHIIHVRTDVAITQI